MSDKNRVKVDPEIREVVLRYIESKKMECKTISNNLKTGDIDNIRILSHRMKGSGKTLGFEKITEIGRALEKAAEKSDFKQIEELNHQLSEYIVTIEVL